MNSKDRLYSAQAERRHRRSLKAKRIATRGEDLAADFLEGKSYRLLARNYRAGRAGEIDIVAMDPGAVVTFVEVKTRSQDGQVFGIPEAGFEAVDYHKQKRILIASRHFLLQGDFAGRRWRYDVIVVKIGRNPDDKPEIIHVPDAFS
jgi:putative endonuclease